MNYIIASIMSFLPYCFILLAISIMNDWVFNAFTRGRLGS